MKNILYYIILGLKKKLPIFIVSNNYFPTFRHIHRFYNIKCKTNLLLVENISKHELNNFFQLNFVSNILEKNFLKIIKFLLHPYSP